MAPPKSLAHSAIVAEIKISQVRIREHIQCIRHTVRGTHRTVRDARDAISRVDAVLARRLSEQL